MLVFAIRLLEGIFVVGSVGCVVVLFLTAIDDLRVLFGNDKDNDKDSDKKRENIALDETFISRDSSQREFSRG
jgi:hypothetical protein